MGFSEQLLRETLGIGFRLRKTIETGFLTFSIRNKDFRLGNFEKLNLPVQITFDHEIVNCSGERFQLFWKKVCGISHRLRPMAIMKQNEALRLGIWKKNCSRNLNDPQ